MTNDYFFEHPLHLGERINYRGDEEVIAALEHGYLELEDMAQGHIVHKLIRKRGNGPGYRYYYQIAGDPNAHGPADFATFSHLKTFHDLHAYQWYPLTSMRDIEEQSHNYELARKDVRDRVGIVEDLSTPAPVPLPPPPPPPLPLPLPLPSSSPKEPLHKDKK